MRLALILLLIMLPRAGGAQDIREAFHGSWGNAAQCAGTLIIKGGSVAHSPVTIGPEWFEQHGIWCRLTWFEPVSRAGGLYVKSRAACGEDASRSYWLEFDLNTASAKPQLTLIWDETTQNAPMHRCETP